MEVQAEVLEELGPQVAERMHTIQYSKSRTSLIDPACVPPEVPAGVGNQDQGANDTGAILPSTERTYAIQDIQILEAH